MKFFLKHRVILRKPTDVGEVIEPAYRTLHRRSLYPRRLKIVMGGCVSGVLLTLSEKTAKTRLV